MSETFRFDKHIFHMRTSEIKDHFQSLKYYYNEDPYGSICMLTQDSK